MTAVTDGYASINVAGPRSRELVGRLTDIDVCQDAFPYMEVRTGTVAGIEGCFVWRIGFTGELSFEIHIPSTHGLTVWEALLDAGADLGVEPFGIEAQRILRLEKGHFIVGQDTDGLSQGHGFGLDRLIKLDKPDFVGKPELVWQSEHGDHPRLVAIQTEDPDLVPLEACQIVDRHGMIRDGSPPAGCHPPWAVPYVSPRSSPESPNQDKPSKSDFTTARTPVPACWTATPTSTPKEPGPVAEISLHDLSSVPIWRVYEGYDIRPGTSRGSGESLVWSVTPGEWTVLGDQPNDAVDLAHARAMFRIVGEESATVINRVCALDLDDGMFPNGAATRTLVAGVATELLRDDVDAVPSYLILPSRSFGIYIRGAIDDASMS